MSDSDDSLTDADWTEPEWPAERTGRARRADRVRSVPVEREPGRTAALVATAVVLAGAAAIAAATGPAPSGPPPSAADGVAVAPVGSYTSSAFCAAGAAASTTIYLTNATRAAVRGVMTSVGPATPTGSVPTVRRAVRVPAEGGVAVNPAQGLPSGSNATSFAFAGGGVVADQVVSGPRGWSRSPCASRVAADWSFAGGSTQGGDALTLSLYNPGATEAVVNVSFIAEQGYLTPQQYQGLVVPAGHLVEEHVGDFVQNQSSIATLVAAQAGTLVASEFQQWSPGATSGLALRLGAPRSSTTWRIAETTTMPGSTVDLYLANPGPAPAAATITLGLASGSVVPHRVVVAPVSIVTFPASATPGLPQRTPYSITVTASRPLVVGRSVQAPPGAPPPAQGASTATTALSRRWLVPGPGLPGAPATPGASFSGLSVANPGPGPAVVEVAALGARGPSARVTVAAGAIAVLGGAQVGSPVAVTVTSTRPIAVEADYGPAGAPGVVSSSGFPFGS